eukprot:366347-Chlamydomonas_euryale.AAC.2
MPSRSSAARVACDKHDSALRTSEQPAIAYMMACCSASSGSIRDADLYGLCCGQRVACVQAPLAGGEEGRAGSGAGLREARHPACGGLPTAYLGAYPAVAEQGA